MILHAIEVCGWRCFADAVRVGPFDERLTVVHAPNGTGKSTLFDALRRAMFDPHRAAGEETKGLRPRGRDLAPRVGVEFTFDGTRYRIEKAFLDAAASRLHRREGDAFAPLAEGDAADERVREMLRGRAGRGAASKAEHFGVADVLWVPQGGMPIDGVAAPLGEHLRASFGAQVGGGGGETIERAIGKAYLELFTPEGREKGGKSPPEYVALARATAELTAGRDALRAESIECDRLAEQIVADRAARDALATSLAEARVAIAALRERSRAFDEAARQRSLAESNERSARLAFDRLARQRDELAAARKAMAEHRATIDRRAAERGAIDAARADAERAVGSADAARADARAARRALDALNDELSAAERFARAAADLDAATRQVARIREADAAVAKARAERAAINAPTADEWRAIQRADSAARDARQAFERSLVRVTFTPAADVAIDVARGEPAGPARGEAGRPIEVRGVGEVVVEIAGVGRLTATGPSGSADQLKRDRDAADAALARLIAPFGTRDLAAIESLVTRAREADDELRSAEAARRAIDGDPARLAREIESARQEIAARPAWHGAPPDTEAMRRRVQSDRPTIDARLSAAERQHAQAIAARTEAERRRSEHDADVATATARLKDATAAEARLLADGGEPAADAVESARVAFRAAQDELRRAVEAIAALGESPRASLDRREREVVSTEGRLASLNSEIDKREGALAEKQSRGGYSELASVEERLAIATADHARERLRADAIRLLRDAVVAERDALAREVAGPVAELATEFLYRIAGRVPGRVRLGDGFGAASLDGEEAIAIATLSGGEREQLHLAVRLALADVLSRSGRQLLVLDDAMTATDASRWARVGELLGELSARMQIVMLTCQPERYAGWPNAAMIDLAAAMRSRNA